MHIVYFTAGNPEYIDMIQLSIETVRHCMPDADIHLFTDLQIAIPGINIYVDLQGYKVPLMVKNTEVWRDFCASQQGEVIFLDPDVLMARKPDLGALGDVAVTWRDNLGDFSKRMPYNTGVVFARCNQNAALFFDQMVRCIEQMPAEDQKWYGNQLALAQLIGEPYPAIKDQWKHSRRNEWVFPLSIDGCEIHQLPCDLYNWTPEGDEPLMNQYFVHLKGNRKFRMQAVHDQILERAV